jgi:hypothetical protein
MPSRLASSDELSAETRILCSDTVIGSACSAVRILHLVEDMAPQCVLRSSKAASPQRGIKFAPSSGLPLYAVNIIGLPSYFPLAC